MATKHIQTFVLKGVDPIKLIADYQAGVFSRPIKTKSQVVISRSEPILAPTYGRTNKDAIYSFKDRNNASVVIATTEHEIYKVVTETGGDLPVGGRCDFCKKDFNHVAVGCPIAYQELTLLVGDKYRVVYVFWVEGEFCKFECDLGYIRNVLARPAVYRDTILRDSESMLKKLYYLTYPTAPPLRAASNPRLLKRNKGSLTEDQWNHPGHIYVRTDRVLMLPAKVEYLQQGFLNPVERVDVTREMGAVTILPQ